MHMGRLKRSRQRTLAYAAGVTLSVCFARSAFPKSIGATLPEGSLAPAVWVAHRQQTHASVAATLHVGISAYRDGDYAVARSTLMPLADSGNATAEFYIGDMYAEGAGVTQDYIQAAAWFREAALQGYAPAQVDLGSVYAGGLGVRRNNRRALQWYRKAAARGNSLAQYNLGVAYARGAGVPRSDKLATLWFYRAAIRGNLLAQNNLGVAYETGVGEPQDRVLAYALFSVAATAAPMNQAILNNCVRAFDLLTAAEQRKAVDMVREMLEPGHFRVTYKAARRAALGAEEEVATYYGSRAGNVDVTRQSPESMGHAVHARVIQAKATPVAAPGIGGVR